MKGSFVLLVVMLTTHVDISAQDETEVTRKQFSLGPTIGYGSTWMTSYDYRVFMPAYSIGVFGIYSPVEHWGIGFDARYSREGSKVDIPESGIVTRRLDYIRVPIRGLYFFGDLEDDLRPKLGLGPSIGFAFGKSVPSQTTVNGIDFGLLGTAGFNYRMLEGIWLNFDAGYYHGFSDVIMHTTEKEKNRNATVNIGVGFEI